MVQEQQKKFGLYLNSKENKLVRINSPYWFPPEPDWVMLTSEVNMTLLTARELAGKKKLVSDSNKIEWGSIPNLD